jgi:PleD family two-component response regulator
MEQAGKRDSIADERKPEEQTATSAGAQVSAGKIIIAVDDMFFAAKILGTAKSVGRQVERVKTREQLAESATDALVSLIIIDLNSAQLQAFEVIETFKAHPHLAAIPILGFLSHVQVELKRRAEQIGCDYVMARSAFSQMLPEILSGKMPKSSAKRD